MKTHKIFGLIALFLITLVSCETEVEDPAGLRGEGIMVSITDVNPAIYIDGELETSYVEFTVDVEEGTTYDKAYIVASYNSPSDRIKIKDIDSFPSQVKITAEEAADAVGLTIDEVEALDYFVFEVVTEVDGLVSRSSGITVRVACQFDPELVYGSYTANSGDWGTTGGIDIVVDDEDPYKVYVTGLAALDGLVEDQGPLVMNIDPLTFEVTAPKTVLASIAWDYHNIAYQGSGTYNSCTGDYEMLFAITVDEGSFGSYEFTFTKN